MIQVSGGTVQLYAFTETLCGQLFLFLYHRGCFTASASMPSLKEGGWLSESAAVPIMLAYCSLPWSWRLLCLYVFINWAPPHMQVSFRSSLLRYFFFSYNYYCCFFFCFFFTYQIGMNKTFFLSQRSSVYICLLELFTWGRSLFDDAVHKINMSATD